MTSLDKPTSDTDRTTRTDQQGADAKAVTEAALFEAFGGVRGMVETVLPGLLFVTIFTINKDLHLSAIAALVVSLVLVAVRLIEGTPSSTPSAVSSVWPSAWSSR